MTGPRLYFLDNAGGRVFSCQPDGTDLRIIVADAGVAPDGIVCDSTTGTLYWTNMGVPTENDGEIRSCTMTGENVQVIVPRGQTHTPKQITIDSTSQRLYWCDREGMRVMSSKLDGSDIQVLVKNGDFPHDTPDVLRWCVGIAVDHDAQLVYWTQKGPSKGSKGRILRCPLSVPADPSTRTDVEVLLDGLPEPIDLELALEHNLLYWTDRGAPPNGNSLNRATLGASLGDVNVLSTGFDEAIGIALDVGNKRAFVTDLSGRVYECGLDGQGRRVLLEGLGQLTGAILV